MDRITEEFGKLVCEFAGLNPNNVLRDFTAENVGIEKMMVTLQVPVFMSISEYAKFYNEAAEKVDG